MGTSFFVGVVDHDLHPRRRHNKVRATTVNYDGDPDRVLPLLLRHVNRPAAERIMEVIVCNSWRSLEDQPAEWVVPTFPGPDDLGERQEDNSTFTGLLHGDYKFDFGDGPHVAWGYLVDLRNCVILLSVPNGKMMLKVPFEVASEQEALSRIKDLNWYSASDLFFDRSTALGLGVFPSEPDEEIEAILTDVTVTVDRIDYLRGWVHDEDGIFNGALPDSHTTTVTAKTIYQAQEAAKDEAAEKAGYRIRDCRVRVSF